MKKRLCVLGLSLALVAVCGCAGEDTGAAVSDSIVSSADAVISSSVVSESTVEEPEEFVFPCGTLDGNSYANEALGLSVAFPDEWVCTVYDGAVQFEEIGTSKVITAEKDWKNSIEIELYSEDCEFYDWELNKYADLSEYVQAKAASWPSSYADDGSFKPTNGEMSTITIQGQEYLYYDTVVEFTYMYELFGYADVAYHRDMYREVDGNYVHIAVNSDTESEFEAYLAILEGK